MHDILNVIKLFLEASWPAFVAAGGVTLIVQLIKKWIDGQSKNTVRLIVAVLSIGSVVIEYMLSHQTDFSFTNNSALVFSYTQLIYHFPGFGISALAQLARDAKAGRELQQAPATSPVVATTTDYSI